MNDRCWCWLIAFRSSIAGLNARTSIGWIRSFAVVREALFRFVGMLIGMRRFDHWMDVVIFVQGLLVRLLKLLMVLWLMQLLLLLLWITYSDLMGRVRYGGE